MRVNLAIFGATPISSGCLGAFSVSASLVEEVKNYIRNQQQHHQRMTFKEEFRELCRRHRVELDERYAWD